MELTLLILSYVGVTLIILFLISFLKWRKWTKCLKLAKKMQLNGENAEYKTKKIFFILKASAKKPNDELYNYHEPTQVMRKIKIYKIMFIVTGISLLLLMIICTTLEYL